MTIAVNIIKKDSLTENGHYFRILLLKMKQRSTVVKQCIQSEYICNETSVSKSQEKISKGAEI